MSDPILDGFLSNLGSDLTGAVIAAPRRRAEEFALGAPKYQALTARHLSRLRSNQL